MTLLQSLLLLCLHVIVILDLWSQVVLHSPLVVTDAVLQHCTGGVEGRGEEGEGALRRGVC